MDKKQIARIVIIVLLSTLLFCTTTRHNNMETSVISHVVDTLVVVRTDTIVKYEPKYITQKKVTHDTIRITKDSIIYLPITQKYYSEKGVYDVWVSGYEPKLDSIKTYRPREIVTIDKLVEREVKSNDYGLYLNGGVSVVQRSIMPSVGVTLVTPKKVYYEANLGIFQGQVMYGAKIGYKLFEK
jgi:hypothetical protein